MLSQPLNMSMMLFLGKPLSMGGVALISDHALLQGLYFAGQAFKLSPTSTVSLSEHEAEETNPDFHTGLYLSEQ